ncbi:MAG TPA: putative toxin-antitoxin system toxin component, PIN family [Pirellulales bacterium]|jgi:hypothetical protein|nr:putative toxin-antitoxin system toxin component, PIN family [Pirellulales bacterium]
MSDVRIVVDTGVVVSAQSISRQAFDVASNRGRLLVSQATVVELAEVLRRPRLNKYLSEEKRLEFLAALIREAELVDISETITACRDAEDDKFLELAVSGKAMYLVSGDQDLLALDPFRGVAIVTPRTFLTRLI